MLQVGVDYRDDRRGRGQRAFDHRRRQAAAADAADHADAAVGLGDAGQQLGRAVGRAVVDENRLPLDPGQRDAELFEQRLDIAGLVERRNNDAQLQRRLAGLDVCTAIFCWNMKKGPFRASEEPLLGFQGKNAVNGASKSGADALGKHRQALVADFGETARDGDAFRLRAGALVDLELAVLSVVMTGAWPAMTPNSPSVPGTTTI